MTRPADPVDGARPPVDPATLPARRDDARGAVLAAARTSAPAQEAMLAGISDEVTAEAAERRARDADRR